MTEPCVCLSGADVFLLSCLVLCQVAVLTGFNAFMHPEPAASPAGGPGHVASTSPSEVLHPTVEMPCGNRRLVEGPANHKLQPSSSTAFVLLLEKAQHRTPHVCVLKQSQY